MTDVRRYAAFSDDPQGGNPAGVVLDATGLDDAAMLAIAAEVGYSETAFITEDRGGGTYRVRYFSPLAEVSFCGHATVATALVFHCARRERVLLRDILRLGTATGTTPLPRAGTRARPASLGFCGLALGSARSV